MDKPTSSVIKLFSSINSSEILRVLASQHRIWAADSDCEPELQKANLHAAELLELCAHRLEDIDQ